MAQGKRTIPYSKPTGWVKDPTATLTVDEARQQMVESAEAAKTTRLGERVPTFIQEERKKVERRSGMGTGGNTPVVQKQDFVDEVPVAAVAQPVRVAATELPAVAPVTELADPAPAAAVVEEEQRDRIETRDFVGEIYRDGSEWVAEITYKNGAGDERFTASSIRELNKKLLEGKGHATIKVRAEVRRRKLGNQLDTFESALLPAIKEVHNLTEEQFYALPESVKESIVASIQLPQVNQFLQEYPEFYNVQSNWDAINAWLVKTSSPATLRNVALAFQDLTEDGLLTAKPSVKTVPQPATAVATTIAAPPAAVVADSTPVAPAPAAAPASAAPRKRGSSGLVPGQSSASPVKVEAATTEEGTTSRELSREELMALPIKELRRRAIPKLAGPQR